MNRKDRRAQAKANRTTLLRAAKKPATGDRPLKILTSLLAAVVKCHESGQLAEAVNLYRDILTITPNLPEVHCNLGAALAALGELAEAEIAYRTAIALKSNYGDAYNNLGNLLSEVGRLTEAEAALRRAVELKPDCPECHSNLGAALKSQGHLDAAEAAYRQAIALNPNLAHAHNNLGDVLCDLGRPHDAEKSLRRAIALCPEFAEAHSNLGNTLKRLGRLDEAEAAYRHAISLKPSFAQALSNLGNVLIDLDRLEDAEEALRRAVALRPDLADAFANLANVLKEQGRSAEAEVVSRQAILLQPGHAQAHSNLGNALRDQGRHLEAEAAYRRAIGLEPNFADAYNNLGVTLKELGRLSEAQQAFEKSIALAPKNPRPLLNLSDLRAFVPGEPHVAAMEELAADAHALPPKQRIVLHFALAKAYDDVDRYDDAFHQLASGNALKRAQIDYDEQAALAAFTSIQAVFTPELLRGFGDLAEISPVPIFVVGMPRSGTTLIEQILASHPRVFGAGEMPALGGSLASLGAKAGITAFPEVMLNVSMADLQHFQSRYLSALPRSDPSVTHITDKMPSNFFLLGLVHLAFPNARIIHVVRDPENTCLSCFSKLFVAGQYFTYDLAELGRYYCQYEALMAHWHRVLPPGRILDVHYEGVVANLEREARRMTAYCGLEWNPRCLAFHDTERTVRTASATQVRQRLYDRAIGHARPYAPHLKPLLAELGSTRTGGPASV